jgi:hypothetical protein
MRALIRLPTTTFALRMFLVAYSRNIALKSRRNSRPPSALPLRHADEESMSSGDESDDMDLTEGSSCGSDISQWNEGTRSRVLYHWETYLVYSKMTPRQRNMFSHSVTPRCLDTTVFQQANLPLGLIAPSSPFGY